MIELVHDVIRVCDEARGNEVEVQQVKSMFMQPLYAVLRFLALVVLAVVVILWMALGHNTTGQLLLSSWVLVLIGGSGTAAVTVLTRKSTDFAGRWRDRRAASEAPADQDGESQPQALHDAAASSA